MFFRNKPSKNSRWVKRRTVLRRSGRKLKNLNRIQWKWSEADRMDSVSRRAIKDDIHNYFTRRMYR